MFRVIAASLLLVGLVSADGAGGFNYDRCDQANGPLTGWGGSCPAGLQKEGTPINLCGAIPFAQRPTIQLSNYAAPTQFDIVNLGKTIQVNVLGSPAPSLRAGNLAQIVGRGNNPGTPTWQLAQLHVHFGRNFLEGSEHFIQGKQFPLEAHFVHFNTQYGSTIGDALKNANSSDVLLVVGVMFQVTESADVEFIRTIAENIPSEINVPKGLSLVPGQLFNGEGDFYSYRGGLTTPGCNEIVTWIVMNDPKPVSIATMNRFLLAKASDKELQSKFGNYRPLQALNGRTIFFSGGRTNACTAVQEPVFTCPAAPVTPVTPAPAPAKPNNLIDINLANLLGITLGSNGLTIKLGQTTEEARPATKSFTVVSTASPWVWGIVGLVTLTAIPVVIVSVNRLRRGRNAAEDQIEMLAAESTI